MQRLTDLKAKAILKAVTADEEILTPIMKSPRLRTANAPVKHAETSRISSLSNGLVPFIIISPFFLRLIEVNYTIPDFSGVSLSFW